MHPVKLTVALALGALAATSAAQAQSHRNKPPPTTIGTGLNGIAKPLKVADQDWRTVDPDDLLVIETNKGRILIEMVPEVAPAHVAQIKTLARQHFYDGQTFFRVIDQFMVQTGDPENTGKGGSKLPNLKPEFTFRRGSDLRFTPVAQPAGSVVGFVRSMPVMSQPDALMVMTASHAVTAWGLFCPGVAGMARDNAVDSANSQFFLMRQAYPSLEKKYTAWGRVVAGLNVVRAIKVGEPVSPPQDRMITVRLASDLPSNERTAVRVIDPGSASFRTLLERVRQEKGADFSVCDIDLPSRVG